MKRSWYLATFLLVIALDQVSKAIVVKNFPELLVTNYRGVWGVLPYWVGYVGMVALISVLLKQRTASVVYWLILAAGLSNMIDRVLYNGVIDWIHTFAWFPVFNGADMVITGGVAVLILREIT